MPSGQRPSMGGVAPLSPAEQDRNEKRVTALFGLNAELIKAAAQLQSEGRGKHPGKGQNSPTIAESGKDEGDGEKKAISSQEYIECAFPLPRIFPLLHALPLCPIRNPQCIYPHETNPTEPHRCMRRIQANLAYLAAVSDRSNKPADKIPPHPAILDTLPPIPGNTIPDAQLQTLANMYKELKEMFGPVAGKGPATPAGIGGAAVNGAQQLLQQAVAR